MVEATQCPRRRRTHTHLDSSSSKYASGIAAIGFFDAHFFQVLTGEIPFRGVRRGELTYSVVEGKRPEKPSNASTIGFSDLLWGFVQRCWDGDMNVRPKVAEVVAHLEEAAANWDGLMPPYTRAENIASDSKEPISDSLQHCEFDILILP